MKVKEYIVEATWSSNILMGSLLAEMADYIVIEIKPRTNSINDQAWWTGCSSGIFSVKSAYQVLR